MRILLVTACILLLAGAPGAAGAKPKRQPFSAHDLVMLERVSDPRLAPDGRHVSYQLRETDLAADKGVHSLWLLDLAQADAPPRRLTAAGVESNTGRWGADGPSTAFAAPGVLGAFFTALVRGRFSPV